MTCAICSKKDTVSCVDCNRNYCLTHHGIHNLITKSHAIKFQTRFNY